MARFAAVLVGAVLVNDSFATFQSLADCQSAYATLQGKEGVAEAEGKQTRDLLEAQQEKNAEQAEELKGKDKQIAELQNQQIADSTPGPSAGPSDTPIDHLAGELTGLMINFDQQYVFGIAFAALGLLSVPFAEHFTVGGSILVAACLVGAIAHNESPPSWHPRQLGGEAMAAGLVAGGLTAAAALLGLQGFQVLMGASLGSLVALLASYFVPVSTWGMQLQTGFYVGSALAGAAVTYNYRSRACALFGPFIGGLWVASSAVYFACSILGSSEVKWVYSVTSLLNDSGSEAAASLGDKWSSVRIGSLVLWGLVAVVGLFGSFVSRASTDEDEDEDDYQAAPSAFYQSSPPKKQKPMQAPLIGRGGQSGSGSLYS